MRMRLLVPAALLSTAVLVPVGTGADAAPADGDVVAGAYIVTVAAGASPEAVARDHGRRLGASVGHVYRHAARGYAARMSATAAARAAADPRVKAVVADRVVRIAGKPGGGGAQPKQTVPTGVTRVLGGAHAGEPVAVIDTGIDVSHPDLVVAGGTNCSTGTSYNDGNGHGTHVAGTVGARGDNSIGVVGVAPGTPLYAVRVLDNKGYGQWSNIICGLDWVTARASTIKVANLSLGGTGAAGHCDDGGLREAICDAAAANVTVVAAAGNSAQDAAGFVPAAYPETIAVSALADSDGVFGPTTWTATCRSDQEDTLADFSNFGATTVDLIAPGTCIRSTWKGGTYNTISGTSMASPHVAAAAALYLRTHPADPAAVKAALQAAGTAEWSGDRDDGFKEPLLRVDSTW